MLSRLSGKRSAPVAGNSDRPGCGRSRPRQGHVHVFERQLLLGIEWYKERLGRGQLRPPGCGWSRPRQGRGHIAER